MPLPLDYPLSFRLRPSRAAASVLAAMHCLAVMAIVISQLPWMLKAFVLICLLASMVMALRDHVWRTGSRAIVSLKLHKEGEIELTYADGCCISTRLDFSSTVFYWLIALRLRHDQRTLSVFMLRDMLDAESWRRLSVLLRATKPSVS